MQTLDQRTLGVLIMLLLGMLVTAPRVATGSILDTPKGNFLVQFVNIFNLFLVGRESHSCNIADRAGCDRNLARADGNQEYINSRQEMVKLHTFNGKATAHV